MVVFIWVTILLYAVLCNPAEQLQIGSATLYRKLKKYEESPDGF
jgi:hypothetical protein